MVAAAAALAAKLKSQRMVTATVKTSHKPRLRVVPAAVARLKSPVMAMDIATAMQIRKLSRKNAPAVRLKSNQTATHMEKSRQRLGRAAAVQAVPVERRAHAETHVAMVAARAAKLRPAAMATLTVTAKHN